jgi:hypothetical protein
VCNVELASLCHRQKGRFLGVGLMPTGHMDDPSVITQVQRPYGYMEEKCRPNISARREGVQSSMTAGTGRGSDTGTRRHRRRRDPPACPPREL